MILAKRGRRIGTSGAETTGILTMKVNSEPNIYGQAQRFADVTKYLIRAGHGKLAGLCLQKAEDIFINGTAEVKRVMSNIYLHSVSRFMEIRQCNVKGLLPDNLRNEYSKQVNASGI